MNLTDALARRGVAYRQSGDKVHINCPFCVERGKPADTKFRCCVHAKQGWGKCLHCDWTRRTAVTVVLRRLGINDVVSGFSRMSDEPKVEPIRLPDDFVRLDTSCDGRERMAWDYAISRGITPEQIDRMSIGVSWTKPWQYRVMFPVVSYEDGVLRCINARDFTGRGKPKYLLSKGDKCLAYFDPSYKACVLSEGVIKALRIEQVCAADNDSAALLGHDLTDIQLEQLKKSECHAVILWPDTDLVGRRGFIKIADKLQEKWQGEVNVVWPVPGPADDVPLRAIHLALMNCEPYTARLRHRMLLAGNMPTNIG